MPKIQFTYNGMEFEANGDCLKDYKTIKALARAKTGEQEYIFPVLEAVFDGKDEEYAEALGGELEAVGELLAAAIEAVQAKNS